MHDSSQFDIWTEEVRARLSSVRLSPDREKEVVDELSQHLDDRWRELIAGGASPDEATRLTLAEFRGRDILAKYMAPLRQSHAPQPLAPANPTAHVLTGLWQDLRYVGRTLRKQSGFAATAMLTLALGIGATTAIFSVVYGVMLKPLPYIESERLVTLNHSSPNGGRNHGAATYFTYRNNQQAFEDVGGWDRAEVTVIGHGDPEQVDALAVTDGLLPILKVQPMLGRTFIKEDDESDAPLRVILSYGYWQRRFGGVSDVIGQSLVVDGRPAEVIGVLPSSFTFARVPNAVMLFPLQLDPADLGSWFGFQVIARLKPGITLEQANADLARMIPLLPEQAFKDLKLGPNIRSHASDVIGNVGNILWILFAAVGVVFLIACGNVANLFLIRAEGRHQELSMRVALGASRGRLARVLLSESLLLSLAGGALGLVVAQSTIGLLRRFAPGQLPRMNELGIDPAVLAFTLAISVMSGVLFGLIAVMKFGRPSVIALKEGGRSATDGPARHRLRNALVVAQVALALVLMIVSGLMIRTVNAMRQVDPGFTQPESVQTFRISIPTDVISDPRQAARAYETIAERVGQVPGVASVGLSSSITNDGENNGNWIEIEGRRDATRATSFRFKSFAPGYFEAMGNRVVAGRSITWSEIYENRPVILISENLARKYWEDPAQALGQRVRASDERPWREIVGIVGDEHDDGLNEETTPIVYWPLVNDSYQREAHAYVVRSNRAGTAAFQRELEQAVWSVNSNLPVFSVETLDEIQARSMAQTSFTMVMLAIAAAGALLLGVVGIFGVITYIATQRTREVGIRIALGAQMRDVRQMFLGYGLRLTMVGIALGIGLASALSRVMSSLLFGVGPTDPMTYASVSAALAVVALLATYLPARRASRVDPVIALRET